LQRRWFKPFGAFIQPVRRHRGEGGEQAVDRIVGFLRIGGVSLPAGNGDGGGKTAAAANFNGVAKHGPACRFPNDAKIRNFLLFRHPFQHAGGAVDGLAFLIAGDEQRDMAGRVRGCRHEGGDGGFHIAGAAAVENPVLDHAGERVLFPGLWTRGNDIGMAGETQMSAGAWAFCEKILDVAEGKMGDCEIDFLKCCCQHPLGAGIFGGDGGAAKQGLGEGNGVH